jgi:YidC/Oxa1 family membrane protein insertase
MEKRLLLAVLLMGIVIMVTNILFPPPPPLEQVPGADTVGVAAPPAAPPAAQPPRPVVQAAPTAVLAIPDTVVVRSQRYEYAFSSHGAALLRARLLWYPSYTEPGSPVQVVPPGARGFLAHRLVIGSDTVDMRGAAFDVSATSVTVDSATGPQSVTFSYGHPTGFGMELTYTFQPDSYLIGIEGRVLGVAGASTLLTELGPGLQPHEAYDHHAQRELAIVSRTLNEVSRDRIAGIRRRVPIPGPLTWAGIKDKYFLVAVIAGDAPPLLGAVAREFPPHAHAYVSGRDTTVIAFPRATLTTALPVATDGTFAFQAYVGPQEYAQLTAVGYALEDVTPYGYRWLQPVIRPFAAFILYILNLLHNTLGIAYGWVLVLFGVMMRVVLWPLNAKAMRATMKNAAIAPRMQEIREKYKEDQEKQQAELVKLYKEEGFNPLAGCLPLLIPFPVLITLFFVFQNTIAFRGARFLWLPDLSLRDPLYLLPVFLMISMFGLQWISTKVGGMEQNPQMKMTMYFMPLAIGVIFFSLPSGLNLYYAATNVASIPQQLLIARERRRTEEERKKAEAAKRPPPRSAPPRKGKKSRG